MTRYEDKSKPLYGPKLILSSTGVIKSKDRAELAQRRYEEGHFFAKTPHKEINFTASLRAR